MNYVPLHLHTEYSLLDGGIKIKDLCKFAKEKGIESVAITDHGVMYGAIDLYLTAKDMGLKPIIGCEFYVYEGELSEKNAAKTKLFHLVLIAKNKQGYQNLVKLVSISHVEGFYYKPRINHKLLEQYSEGLICLSACVQGELPKSILENDRQKALETAKYYKSLFKDDYYIEIQDHGLDKQKRSNPDLIKIAKELDIKLVITNDSHYLRKEDSNWHDTLLCIQTNASKDDMDRFRFPNDEFYVKTPDELKESFKWLDEDIFNSAIATTCEIADKCHLILEMGKSNLPSFDVPTGYTVESYLDFKAREGLKKRYGEITPELEERYRYELGIIEKMGFSAYFLITWDFINYAKESDIPVGPGRGSAAGSLIAYALGITDIDPIRHNLLFERFLNPERVSMPDVDIDFCVEGRGKVIEYVAAKYGVDNVSQIITFNTLAARNALKAVARAYKLEFAESNRLSQMIPTTVGIKIEDALKDGMELRKACDANPLFKKIVDMAQAIEGLKNGYGMHAAGVIISHLPLNEIVPVQPSKEGIIITEYAMSDLEKLGLLKMDFLGLRNLTIIKNALDLIKQRHGKDIDINNLPLDDAKTYELLTNGTTDGVFQLESSGMKALVKRLQPNVFEDIGALVALFRPGPLDSGMVDDFVERKHGRQKVVYLHPSLEPILKDTYGTIVYQEQIMQIAQVLAGYTLGQADVLRRAMGKKKTEVMEKEKAGFVDGAVKNGVDKKIADDLFDTMSKFAAYCFNRSHSAAYAFIAYQTAYLKAHYPVEYFSALLSSVNNDQDKTQAYIAEAQEMGIEVLAPDINRSCSQFTPDEGNIRFGLASIKNVGQAVIECIEKEREEGEFKSIWDFSKRVDTKCLNKKTLESLIKSGAFLNIEKSRKQLIENLENIVSTTQKQNEAKQHGQVSLFSVLPEEDTSFIDSTNKLLGSDEEYDDREIQLFEKEYLGFYVTSHPLSSIKDKLPYLTTHNICDLSELPNEKPVTVCGLLTQIRQIPTKKDPNKFLKVGIVEDLTGRIEFVAFHKVLTEFNSLIEAEKKVILSGKIQIKDENPPNLIINSVKSVDNSNIVTVSIPKDMDFGDIVLLKDVLLQFKGDDPLMLAMEDEGEVPVKILSSAGFWLHASNDIATELHNNFGDRVKVEIRSLDE